MPQERKSWTIEVVEADIEEAHRDDSYRCVVAKAIRRTIPDASRVEVDLQTIRFTRNGMRHVYLTPYAAAGYVVAFDAGDEIEPFSFLLRNPQLHQTARKTEAGRVVDNARNRVYREKQRVEKAKAVVSDPDATEAQKIEASREAKVAKKAAEKADQEFVEMREAYREAAKLTHKGRRPAPKVYKSKQRAYGSRMLRVNQAEGRKHFNSQAQRYDGK